MDAGRLRPDKLTRQTSRPSVGIRRLTSTNSLQTLSSRNETSSAGAVSSHDFERSSRRRSTSEPDRPTNLGLPDNGLTRPTSRSAYMPSVAEESSSRSRPATEPTELDRSKTDQDRLNTMPTVVEGTQLHSTTSRDGTSQFVPKGRRRRAGTGGSTSHLSIGKDGQQGRSREGSQVLQPEYDADLVNLLDVIDPEVSVLSSLTNVQNSLFVPDLGRFLNRRPTYTLSARPTTTVQRPAARKRQDEEEQIQEEIDGRAQALARDRRASLASVGTITSQVSETRYAVLPHGMSLDGWTEAEKQELNDHVRHLLHSRRAAFKRGMRGFGQYVRKPLGLFVTIYATLITLFGLAWVLFLIGWLNVGGRQLYVINVIDNVLVALFAIMGDGLIPFRTIDTYHMIYIAHYHHLTWRLRKKKQLPELPNHNDLPASRPPSRDEDGVPSASAEKDLESGPLDGAEKGQYTVLTAEQQRKLEHHQTKFSKSHTFYKPHETETHFAFPLRLLVAIVVLLDFHSIFQVALGTCTWAISYHVRPMALTTVILCCSLTCNITGGILISIGDHRTRKKDVKERMFRQQLTEDAIHKIEVRKHLT